MDRTKPHLTLILFPYLQKATLEGFVHACEAFMFFSLGGEMQVHVVWSGRDSRIEFLFFVTIKTYLIRRISDEARIE